MSTLRRATLTDHSQVLRTLVRAFARDPLVRFMLPDDDAYEAWQGAAFFHLVAGPWFDTGEVWVTDDVVAVSVWGVPDPVPVSDDVRADLIATYLRFDEATHARMAVVDGALRPLRPEQPYWYLNFLATHPDWQRRGLGGRLCAVTCDRADEAGLVQYLETATDDDIAFYAARGFQVRDTVTLTAPAAEPHSVTVTTMLRPPQRV